jgi:hypothetical protein
VSTLHRFAFVGRESTTGPNTSPLFTSARPPITRVERAKTSRKYESSESGPLNTMLRAVAADAGTESAY